MCPRYAYVSILVVHVYTYNYHIISVNSKKINAYVTGRKYYATFTVQFNMKLRGSLLVVVWWWSFAVSVRKNTFLLQRFDK